MKQLFIFFCFITSIITSNAQTVDESQFSRYLFAYFVGGGDQQEYLRFGLSRDAFNWRALNENHPIVGSDTIAKTKGIRDPHILRGENGEFLIVATDMNTQRDGWRENPGIVLLRSYDLVNWTHSFIDLPRQYPSFSDAYWVWAPQVIYDANVNRYMIYFTLQRTNDNRSTLITYYAYANDDFTDFCTEPKVLFKAKYGSIDNDIIMGPDGKWHLFYKGNTKDANGNEIKNGIQQAVSDNLTGPYTEDFVYLDAYADSNTGVEGSSTFKLIGEQKYILMYDLYGAGRYEYQTSNDLWKWTRKPQSFTKDFNPRHGSVIPITLEEATRLVEAFPSMDIDSILCERGEWAEPEDPNGKLLLSYSFDKDSDDEGLYPVTLKGSAQFVWLDGHNRVLSTGNDEGYLDLGKTAGPAIFKKLSKNYTISLDICVDNNGNSLDRYCWAWAFGNGQTNIYSALVNSGGNRNWYYEIKNNDKKANTNSSMGISTGKWHTITVVQKNGYNKIYVDGQHCGSTTADVKPSNFATSAKQCWLGKSPYENDAYMTNTLMDNLRIYNKALTTEQVKDLYESRPTSTKIVTAIMDNNIDSNCLADDNDIYNLSGQRIASPQRGINIVNHKKIWNK